MKYATERLFADSEKAARRLMEHAQAFEPRVDWLAEQPAIPEYHASPETLAAIRAIDREKTEHQRPRQRRQAPI
jgi:hypothetical protein